MMWLFFFFERERTRKFILLFRDESMFRLLQVGRAIKGFVSLLGAL